MPEIKEIIIMTPEEMAAAQKNLGLDKTNNLYREVINHLALIIELTIFKARYIPYQDHPSCNHPKNNVSQIEIPLLRSGYLQYLKDIFEPKGWQLLPGSPWSKNLHVVVAQTVPQRKAWIVKQMTRAGHELAPWNHPDDLGRWLDKTHCLNDDCMMSVEFRPNGPTEYPLGEGVWASDLIKCPATPSSED